MKSESMIGKAMVQIMNEVKAIGKDSDNRSQGFKFRGIDAVMNNLHPIFAKAGVVILPEIIKNEVSDRMTSKGTSMIHRVLEIRYRFVAEDASELSCTVIGEALDTGDKTGAKCLAIGLKYALSQVLLLPYDEVDPDAESHSESNPIKKPAKQSEPIEKRDVADASMDFVQTRFDKVQIKTGKSAKGEWVRTYAKGADGEWYQTFSKTIGERMQELEGIDVNVTFKIEKSDKGDSRSVIAIDPDEQVADEPEQDNIESSGLPF